MKRRIKISRDRYLSAKLSPGSNGIVNGGIIMHLKVSITLFRHPQSRQIAMHCPIMIVRHLTNARRREP